MIIHKLMIMEVEKKLFYNHNLVPRFLNSRWGYWFQFYEHSYDPLVIAGMKEKIKKLACLNKLVSLDC